MVECKFIIRIFQIFLSARPNHFILEYTLRGCGRRNYRKDHSVFTKIYYSHKNHCLSTQYHLVFMFGWEKKLIWQIKLNFSASVIVTNRRPMYDIKRMWSGERN